MNEVNEGRALHAVLVSMRDREDPMAAHEFRCFRERAGLTDLDVVYAIDGDLGEGELVADLLFFGGSGAYSVLDSETWIRKLLDFLPLVPERNVPAWASCFAFQGLALALGGEVYHSEELKQLGGCELRLTEAGKKDPLFTALPEHFSAQFGHQDHVRNLPTGLTATARGNGDACQAFRVASSNFWGAQFHPELTKQTTLERWIHYRTRYEGESGDEIDRHLRRAPETPHVERLLTRLVSLASQRAQKS